MNKGNKEMPESKHIINTTDNSFPQDVLQNSQPVLVDFWAEWCGPCRAIAPILAKVAEEYQGKVTVVKINVEENPQTPASFGVLGIPTLILFKNGEVQARHVGSLTEAQLKGFLDNHL